MPTAYSLDLRQRVLACAQEEQLTHGALAERFRVGESTVRGWLRRVRLTGSIAPTRHVRHGRAPVIDGERAVVLRTLLAEDNARTLAELADLLAARTDAPRLSLSAVCRACQRLDLRRKKKERPARRTDAGGRGRGAHRVA